MEINQEKIEAAIVQQAVDNIVREDDIYDRVRKGVEARVDALFAAKVSAEIDEAITAVIRSGFEREYSKRDSFGRAIGEPTTISAELERLVGNYWTDRVDSGGKITTSTYSTTSRAEWLMTQICADDFSKQMKQHVVNVGGAVKDHFRAVLNTHVASMLSDVFHVQSGGDKALKNPGRSCIDAPAKPIGEKA